MTDWPDFDAMNWPELERLHFFDDRDDLVNFAKIVWSAYSTCLTVLAAAGNATGEANQAAMVGRLVTKMLQYKADRAAEMAQDGVEYLRLVDGENTEVWQPLEVVLEQELAEAGEILDKLRAEQRRNLN